MEGSLSQHEIYLEKPLQRININDFIHQGLNQLSLAEEQFYFTLLTG
jgi:hypothetical protein